MLVEFFPKWADKALTKALRAYFGSTAYLITTVLIMVCSELFSLEIFAFWLYVLLGGVGFFFCRDASPLVPILGAAYMSLSGKNNPAAFPETNAFTRSSFRIQFYIIVSLGGVLLLLRLITAIRRFPRKKMPRLTVGYGVLGISLVLGGLFSGFYDGQTALFGFVEILSLAALYFYFYYTIDWETLPKDYLFRTFALWGAGIVIQIVGMYFPSGKYIGVLYDRGQLFTGWGMYNNVGAALDLCIPAVFYFAATAKRGWIYTLIASFYLCAVAFTQSRGSMLFGGVVFLFCFVYTLCVCDRRERIFQLAICELLLIGLLIVFLVLREKIVAVFFEVLEAGADANGRLEIYGGGWKQFLAHPVFGEGFYACKQYEWAVYWGHRPVESFLAPRYHNTYIQLLASGGIFALLAYLLHRFETVVVLFKNPTKERVFYAAIIAALLLTSLLDCHFFNFGPGLLYATVLAFGECMNEKGIYKRGPNAS